MDIKIKKIIKSNRKTIALQVCDDTSLVIRVPLKTRGNEIEKIICKHSRWIEKNIKEINSHDVKFTQKKFVDGENFLYLGSAYPLKISNSNEQTYPLLFNKGFFSLSERIVDIRAAFLFWYREEAKNVIFQSVRYYAKEIGLDYNKIKISNARKQWGSCTRLNNLNFSWRLIMAPYSVINYVVVHELVHIIEKNHSKKFWKKVHSIMPDYKIQRNWLKKNGYLLTI
jgi:predicted metal-dependent hydrolase